MASPNAFGSAHAACVAAKSKKPFSVISPHSPTEPGSSPRYKKRLGSACLSSPSPLTPNASHPFHVLVWSGRWDLNPRQLAWEARTLPLSYARSLNRILRWLRSQVNRTGETLSALALVLHRELLTLYLTIFSIPRPQIFFGQPSGGRFVPPQSRSQPSRRFASARQPLGLPE